MDRRRSLLAIVLMSAALHAVGIARTLLPSQDGLKLIRFARSFQTEPFTDAVRGADVHPLYPMLIALAEPPVSWMIGEGPEAWQVAAQLVSAFAALALIVPIYFLTERLFDRRVAFIAAGLLALLPRIAEVGHDTLADSLGLLSTFMALWLASRALTSGNRLTSAGAGLFAALGYLARPEVILVPAVIALAWLIARFRPISSEHPRRLATAALMLAIPAMAVAGYAAVKGQVSEKLSLRTAAGLGPQAILHRSVPQQVPRGLDDPRWDFSAKEESDHVALKGTGQAARRIFARWWEAMAWYFAVMAAWGVVRRRELRKMLEDDGVPQQPRIEGLILGLFVMVYTAALIRHSATLGYLSGRHVLPIVVAAIPWAAAGMYLTCRRIGILMRLSPRAMRLGRLAPITFTLLLGVGAQLNPHHRHHLSRWGHWAAGQWLSTHAAPGEELLDTRGWARFVSGLPGYDYWHIRQALTDSNLKYILVGIDELEASSARAETLRSLLAFSATPLADFPAAPDDPTPSVRLYRYQRPDSWEGLVR